ncbi:ELP3-like acetyltransferase [Cryptosporidium canis]|uniref:tRNA carboxymethyluridine synthase n=1 Tax=Cryptosporidium canis TaxID=195482 RepID=A0ABQ8P2H8_9CRYT|nr:ELP3-like acetyltransferase [Cryptosporidium canis]KAJ1612281.1 ELP3-like acetyltransferase [Cryptosporidium canis]
MQTIKTQEDNSLREGVDGNLPLTFEEVNHSIPAFREDFPANAGEIKQLTREDLLNEHRRRHLESYCKSSAEWSNYEKRQKNDEEFEVKSLSSFIHDLILLSPKTKEEYENVINTLRRRHKIAPSKAQIIRVYEELVSQKGLEFSNDNITMLFNEYSSKDNQNQVGNNLEKTLLSKKAVRSQSGVIVITILTSPGAFSCKHDCHYCPNEPGQPRSYLSTEPAVLRANQNSFDAIKQFRDRSITLKNNGHTIDKIEILVLGGTWSGYPREYQCAFIRDIYYAANTFTNKNNIYDNMDYIDREKKSLLEEVELNQTAECRIIGLTLETRPDYINLDEILQLREFGCTRVQLGIQHTDYWVLKLINRGCYMRQIVKSIRLLKDTGYKVDIHLMPDLPNPYDHSNAGSLNLTKDESNHLSKRISLLKDLQVYLGFQNAQTLGVVNDYLMLSNVLSNPKLQCDQWKLYPCEVVPFSKIEEWYEYKDYVPYAEIFPDTLCYLLLSCKVGLHPWIRVNRVIRDIPNQSIIAGNSCTNLRQMIHDKMKALDLNCRCLRCREIKDKHISNKQLNQASTNSNSNLNSNEKEEYNGKLKSKKNKKSKKLIKNKDINTYTRVRDTKIVLRIRKYNSFGGSEFFISVESKDEIDLYGFIRLRVRFKDEKVLDQYKDESDSTNEDEMYSQYSMDEFTEDSEEILEKFPVLRDSALIRELHIYGTVVPHYINEKDAESAVQHRGFGKTLLRAAEYLAFIHGFSRIVVISGVGVREYYANNGYFLQDTYMVKVIDTPPIINELDIHFLDCSLDTDLFKTLIYIKSVESNNQLKEQCDNRNIPGLATFKEIALEEYANSIDIDIYNNAAEALPEPENNLYKNSTNSTIRGLLNNLKYSVMNNFNNRFSWMIGISIFTSSIFGLSYLRSRRLVK